MKAITQFLIILSVVLFGCQPIEGKDGTRAQPARSDIVKTESAVFAGGCFWCTESDFEKVDGVSEAISGYIGGHVMNPTYKQVSRGGTGHVEAVKVIYDPARITYGKLLEIFWRHVDPTDAGGQFVDRGYSYRSAIFYGSDREHRLAEASKRALAGTDLFDKPIVTDILPRGEFYPAETYHQNYYKKNPIRYKYYRSGSGRDRFLRKQWTGSQSARFSHQMWVEAPMGLENSPSDDSRIINRVTPEGKPGMKSEAAGESYPRPSKSELRRRLTPLQYKVTQEEGTEPPYRNAFWDHHGHGIYVDIVSGEPLFSSADKFNSRTGWPSFTRPLVSGNIVDRVDRRLFMTRTEVRSKHADSHLGHIFKDGPAPTGLRYCINSAALRFVAKEDLKKEGYGQYRHLFE